MRFILAIVGGVVGGVIGATIWAIVSMKTGYEIGWIAWGIGVLAGLGVAVGARDDRDSLHGVLAAVIALCAIGLGKWASIHFVMSDAIKRVHASHVELSDEDAQLHIAHDLVAEYESNGKSLKWPAGQDVTTARAPEDYPKELWADAKRRWAAMGPADQAGYKEQVDAYRREDMAGMLAQVEQSAYKKLFTAWDVLWGFLAIGSAFKLGAGVSGSDD